MQTKRANGNIQFANNTQQLLISSIDIFREEVLHFWVRRARRELSEDQIVLDPGDEYLAYAPTFFIDERNKLPGL